MLNFSGIGTPVMRRWIALAACFTAVLSAAPAPIRLRPGRTVNGLLAFGETRLYRVELTGDVRVTLEQYDADFGIEILRNDGKLLRTVDSFEWGKETATVTGAAGVFRVRIRRGQDESVTAPYQLTLQQLDAALQDDDVWVRAEDTSTEARRMRRKATADDLRQAVDAARRAVQLWDETGDKSAHLRASIMLADALHDRGVFDKARALYTEALARSVAAGAWRSAAECLNNRALGRWQQRAYAEALDDLGLAMTYWDKLPAQTGRGASLSNLGLVSWEVGEFQSALDYFARARRVLRPLGYRRGLAFVTNNAALVEGVLGQSAASVRSFRSAALVFESLGERLAAGRAFSNSARMYLRLGDIRQADSVARRGLALVERAGNERALAESLNMLAEVCTAVGSTGEALSSEHRALALARRTKDVHAEANALANIGLTLLACHRAGAIASLEAALAIYRRSGTPAAEASILYHLARARAEVADIPQARRSSEAAVEIAERLRGNVAAERFRVSFLASTHDYYATCVDILMQQGDVRAAWEMAERSRARALLDALDRPRSSMEQNLRRQVSAASFQLWSDPDHAEQHRHRLDELSAALIRLEDGIGRAPQPAPRLEDVQNRFLDNGTALLEYSLGESRGYVFMIRRDSVMSFRLPARKRLAAHIQSLTDVLREGGDRARAAASDPEFRRAAAALSAALIVPGLPHLTTTRLLIVPDAELQFVPFSCLPLPGGAALIDRFQIQEAPSAAVMAALIERRKIRSSISRRIAILADPVFQANDTRFVQPALKNDPSVRFARLPFSGREATAVASLLPKGESTVLLGFEASKQALTSGRFQDYQIVHISTHNVLDTTNPALSGLVLSLVNQDGSARDGLLSLEDVHELRLNADLVVLSACETALGKSEQGEGLMSLTRSFLHAGAARVLATLWRVDDEATAQLLRHFYRGLWHAGLSPAAALRQAQLAVRREPRWNSPFYWASFVLQGAPETGL